MRMEPTESSETSAINVTWAPGTYPKDNKLQLEHSESLKSRLLQSLSLETIMYRLTQHRRRSEFNFYRNLVTQHNALLIPTNNQDNRFNSCYLCLHTAMTLV